MSSVGVDPGQTGFQCLLPLQGDGAGWVHREPVFSLPPHDADGRISRAKCLRLCRDWFDAGARLVVVEQQQPMRKKGVTQGVVAVWSLATTFATWTTALEAAGFREAEGIHDVRVHETGMGVGMPVYLIVAAQTWKAHMGCMGAEGDRKRALQLIIEAARAGFPGVDLRAVERAKDLKRHKDSADRAAALLLSEFGRRLLERSSVRA